MSEPSRLIIADSETCSDLFWATRFFVPDPIWFLQHEGRKILVASDLEYGRAKKEAEVHEVLRYSRYVKRLQDKGLARPRDVDVISLILTERRIRRLLVPTYFPYRYAKLLTSQGFRLEIGTDPFYPERQIKSKEEKAHIVKSVRATEEAIRLAMATLKKSRIRSGRLYWGGTLLTSEQLRRMMELKMMELGYLGRHTIVACGRQAADPHCIGFGPLLANQPIVLDVFPKSITTGYFGDVTRTVVKGKAGPRLREMYEAVRQAQAKGVSLVRDGADAPKVHEAVAEALVRSGFRNGTTKGKPQGFIHTTGHGLGLDIHELPRISKVPATLKKGQVLTVEPGLYYEELGGVRIEDDVYVTTTGCEVLSALPRHLMEL